MFDPYQVADSLQSEDFEMASVETVNDSTNEVEVRIEIANPDWGLPSEVYRYLNDSDAVIEDFTHVSEDGITLYLAEA